MIQPLASYYFTERLLAAPDSETLILPADEPTYDALVIAVGPGRQQDDGTQQSMQAQPGDRVVCLPKDFWEWGTEFCGVCWGKVPCGCAWQDECIVDEVHRGFIHNRDLVAVIPGPDHADIYPANDYVLIEPDRLYQEDGGNVVQVRESGILVASHTLIGGEDRAKQEGWVAYQKSRELWESEAWQAEPEYFRHRRLHAYLDGLHPEVRQWCRRFAESEEAPAKRMGWVQREAPTRGRVVDVACVAWTSGALMFDAATGINWDVMPGDIVRWSADHEGVLLQVGERQLLALRAEYLMAVEVE
jgi:hypothetical protein